jgi:transcriptional regulator with XRE-family HTH domain
LRQRAGIKQADVARRLGVDPSVPSLWEQGKRPVPSRRIGPLADVLGISVAELLGTDPVPAVLRAEPEPRSVPLWAAADVSPPVSTNGAARAASQLTGVALDAPRAEQPRHRAILRDRLCDEHRRELGPNAEATALVERLAAHCAGQPEFLDPALPLLERIFRMVLGRRGGPVPAHEIVDHMRVPAKVLGRLGHSARSPYPLAWQFDTHS